MRLYYSCLAIEFLHKRRVLFLVESTGKRISCLDEHFFRATEEGRNLINETGGCVVGATAGIQTSIPMFAKAACRCGVASVSNNPMLASAVNPVVYIAEVEFCLVANTDQA